MAKLVHGVGINDADYTVSYRDRSGVFVICPFYNRWKGMLERGYSVKLKEKLPIYKNVYVEECLEDVGTWVAERKVLILGNHCRDNVSMEEICKHFDEVYSLKKYKEFWLSHAPIHPQELRGKYNVHGHVHYATIDDPRYFNCCLENTEYFPIDLNEVRKRLGITQKVYK